MVVIRAVLLASALLAGCDGTAHNTTVSAKGSVGKSWWQWHDDKRAVDRAVDQAINEPGGGDYAKAVQIIRQSSRPPAVKQFEIGQLIVGGIMERASLRPPETLEQGLRMMEDASVAPGQQREANVQQLRFLFERGNGTPPVTFPKDAAIARCWLAVEQKQNNDRARCIALRRQRLPNIVG